MTTTTKPCAFCYHTLIPAGSPACACPACMEKLINDEWYQRFLKRLTWYEGLTQGEKDTDGQPADLG